jgi:anti-anti-sigma factor
MNAEILRDGQLRAVHIDGEMTIYRALELKEILQGALKGGAGLELDLSNVTELDTAGLQLLMAAQKSAPQFRIAAVSEAVAEVFATFDLGAHFGVRPEQA